MFIVMAVFNFQHPGRVLGDTANETSGILLDDVEGLKDSASPLAVTPLLQDYRQDYYQGYQPTRH